MPRIPDATALGERRVPVGRAPTYEDRSGEIMAEAIGSAARQLSGVVTEFADHRDEFRVAKAGAEFSRLESSARQFEDNDWETYEERYRKKLTDAKDGILKNVRLPRNRETLGLELDTAIERGAVAVRGVARAKEVEFGRADLSSTLDTFRTSALSVGDEESRAANIRGAQTAIRSALDNRYIEPTDAERLNKQWTQSYAEGFIGMQPVENRIKILSNPNGTAADLLPPDRRVDLLRQAQDEQRILKARQEAEAKQAQAEARQRLGERVRDATAAYRLGLEFDSPPSRYDFVAVFGPEDGNKEYTSFAKEQQLGADLRSLALMPPNEQEKLLQERVPVGTAGVAESSERYRVLSGQLQTLRRQLDADPASYVAQYSPRVESAFAASEESPEAARQYATATIAEQKRLGVAQPKVLPEATADEIAQSFYTQNGEQVAALIQTEQEKWGNHWPQVFSELAAKKIPPAALAIGRGMAPGPATRLASVSTTPLDELKKGVDVPSADIRTEIDSAMTPFLRTLDGVVGAENTYAGMRDAVERLAYSYLRQGKSNNEAVEQAYNEVLGDHYAFREVNGRLFRVPTERDIPGLEIGAQRALSAVKADQLLPPLPTSTSNEETAITDLKRAIQRRGYWVTSANGENGLALFLDGAPVLRKDGNVYEVSWDALTADIAETRSAIQQQETERMMREAEGLR